MHTLMRKNLTILCHAGHAPLYIGFAHKKCIKKLVLLISRTSIFYQEPCIKTTQNTSVSLDFKTHQLADFKTHQSADFNDYGTLKVYVWETPQNGSKCNFAHEIILASFTHQVFALPINFVETTQHFHTRACENVTAA